MPTAAKIYVASVIAGGGVVLTLALSQWQPANMSHFLIFLVLSVGASLIKIRLPHVTGTYSLSFFFILIGISYFSLPETLVAACAAALAGTVLVTSERPLPVQVAFNMANLVVSIGACFLVASQFPAAGSELHRPAILALVAFLYFVVNTVLVSGVLSLLQGKRLLGVCEEWYVWSFPYYLVGVAVVGLLPLAGQSLNPTSALIVLPVLYLLHFYHGLSVQLRPNEAPEAAAETDAALPTPARIYVGLVITLGFTMLAWGMLQFESDGLLRFLAFLAIALLTSIWKVALPKMTNTISVNFVVLLAAMAELSLPEVMILAGASTVVQSFWRPEQKPKSVQVLFNMAALVASTALGFWVFHELQAMAAGESLALVLFAATAVLYSSNTIIVSAAVCLAESLPLSSVWQGCCFWSFPYYVVGAVFAGLMIVTSQAASWPASFVVLPLMALVYVSYRLHVKKAEEGPSVAAVKVSR